MQLTRHVPLLRSSDIDSVYNYMKQPVEMSLIPELFRIGMQYESRVEEECSTLLVFSAPLL